METVKSAAVHEEDAVWQNSVLTRCHHDFRVDAKRQAVAVRHVKVCAVSAFNHVHHFVQKDKSGAVLHALTDVRA